MPDETKNQSNQAAGNNRDRENVSQQGNAPQKDNHRTGGENQSTDISIHRYPGRVDLRVGKVVFHIWTYATGRDSAVVPSIPPNPMLSTAEEGTITVEPFSLIAS